MFAPATVVRPNPIATQAGNLPVSSFLRFDGAVSMRHVKARPESLPDAESLKSMIQAAYADIKSRLAAEQSVHPRGSARSAA